VSFIGAQAKGAAQLRILAEGNNATAREEEIMTRKGSPVTTVADLRGQTIAVNAAWMVEPYVTQSEISSGTVAPFG
jgi:ABC-type nitrate/sulfonate/bicarbonate transport system substrate-binding protein